jgi:hypothetical protein
MTVRLTGEKIDLRNDIREAQRHIVASDSDQNRVVGAREGERVCKLATRPTDDFIVLAPRCACWTETLGQLMHERFVRAHRRAYADRCAERFSQEAARLSR